MRIILIGMVLLMTEDVFAQTFKSTAQLSGPITPQKICELVKKSNGTVFEMNGLPEMIEGLKKSIDMPELQVVICLIPGSDKTLVESISITTHVGEPLLLIILNQDLLSYFKKKKIVGERLTQHLNASFAHEFAHIAVSDTVRCRDLAIATERGQLEDMLNCEYEADFKAATWVGRESMVETLKSISGLIQMKIWLLRRGLSIDDPVMRLHFQRIQLLSRKKYVPGRIFMSP